METLPYDLSNFAAAVTQKFPGGFGSHLKDKDCDHFHAFELEEVGRPC